MKRLILILLSAALLLSLAACSSEAPESTMSPTGAAAETAQPTAEPPPSTEPANQIRLDMDLEAGKMDVVASYSRENVTEQSFMLNRDFEVTKILCDGQEVDVDEAMELVVLGNESVFDYWYWVEDQVVQGGEYLMNLYHLPSFEQVMIEYTGILNVTRTMPHSNSVLLPYAQEVISAEFTLLRFETGFHPLFADPENYQDVLTSPLRLHMTVNVPEGYTAAFAYTAGKEETTQMGKSFAADLDMSYTEIATAIAKYKKVETDFGDFYLLENSEMDISWTNAELSRDELVRKSLANTVIEVPFSYTPNDTDERFDFALRSFISSPFFNIIYSVLTLSAMETEPLSFPKFEGDSCSMLFVGNSYVMAIPEQLQAIAGLYGINIRVDNASAGSARLHYSNIMNNTLEFIENNQYDFVVVMDDIWMEEGTDGIIDINMTAVETIFNAAEEKGSTPVLYSVGEGLRSYTDADGRIMPDLRFRLYSALMSETVAKRLDAIHVNASEAWVYAYDQIPDISLFIDDGARHATLEGVYYNACVLASTLFDLHIQDVMDAEGIGEVYPDWYNLGPYVYAGENAVSLGQSAWEFVSWYKEHQTYPG
jgi:hypothetical protein